MKTISSNRKLVKQYIVHFWIETPNLVQCLLDLCYVFHIRYSAIKLSILSHTKIWQIQNKRKCIEEPYKCQNIYWTYIRKQRMIVCPESDHGY